MSKRPGKRKPHGRSCSPQQEAFCQEFVRAPSATQAAIRAGYSPASAKKQACLLKQLPQVKRRITELMTEADGQLSTSRPRIERELEAIAFADLRDLVTFGPDGVTIRSSAEIDPVSAAAILKVRSRVVERQDEDGETTLVRTETELELHPKLPALKHLSQLVGYMKGEGSEGALDPSAPKFPPVLLTALRE